MTYTLTSCAMGLFAPNSMASPDTLAFTSVSVVGPNMNQKFHVTAEWPLSLDIPNNKLAVLSSPSLASNSWDWTDAIDVNPLTGFSENDLAMSGDRCFYKLATMEDTTGSGIPDFYEMIINTNPDYQDPDGDGLPSWYEDYIGSDPNNPYSLAEGDTNNPSYFDEDGNPLTDGEILGGVCDCVCEGDPEDKTPPDWDGIMMLQLSLCDMFLDDDGWELYITVPFKESPDTNAVWNPAGAVLDNLDDVESIAYRTVYIEAGQNVEFYIKRVEIGQNHWSDEFQVTIEAFIPESDETPAKARGMTVQRGGITWVPAPNWIQNYDNPPLEAWVYYGVNDELPDVSEYVWQYTAYQVLNVLVDDDSNGLCVKVGNDITMRCEITPDMQTAFGKLSPDCVMWQFRTFNNSELWGEWKDIGKGETPESYTYTTEKSGVFGVRPLFVGNPVLSPIYRRKYDEPFPVGTRPSISDSSLNAWWRKGMPDAVGVCETQFQVDLRNAARAHLGSTEYALYAFVSSKFGVSRIRPMAPKCNIFIAHLCRSIDINSVPVWERGNYPSLNLPPVAKEWAKLDNEKLTAWTPPPNLQPGCVVSYKNHMGITDYDGYVLNAGLANVNKGFYCFMLSAVFRMYTP